MEYRALIDFLFHLMMHRKEGRKRMGGHRTNLFISFTCKICWSNLSKIEKSLQKGSIKSINDMACNWSNKTLLLLCLQLLTDHFFLASPAFVFLTPRTFLALFFLSFICFLDFSTLVSNPFLISLYFGSYFLAFSTES